MKERKPLARVKTQTGNFYSNKRYQNFSKDKELHSSLTPTFSIKIRISSYLKRDMKTTNKGSKKERDGHFQSFSNYTSVAQTSFSEVAS